MKNFRLIFDFFFEILPKLSDFENSDDCIEKSHQNLSDYNHLLFKKRFKVIKKENFSSGKNEKFR